ncbi:MAG: type II toxin-antitoxin system YafQ family toxin [Defluviitaleaceae bacterium]|nr:type II toxin-antitoxin system YafQ family toxin [Defluviitaleaceae bacterium]
MNHKRRVLFSAKYRKEYHKAIRQKKNIDLLDWIVGQLADDIPLPESHKDHPLKGDWRGYRECHITPDWLLIYKKQDGGELILSLTRLNSHSNLF